MAECEEALGLSSALIEYIARADGGATRSAGVVWRVRAAFLRRKANATALLPEGAALSHEAALEAERRMRHDCALTPAQVRLRFTPAHAKRTAQTLKDLHDMEGLGDKLGDLRMDCAEILLAQIAKEKELICTSKLQ